MLIAFIDNPIQTVFIYVLLVMCIVIVFVYFYSVYYIFAAFLFRDRSQQTTISCCTSFLPILLLNYNGSLFMYLIITVILLLNIGGFDNFGELKKLSWPIATAAVLAIGGYFLKPKIRPSDNNGNVRPSDNIIVNQLSVQNTDQ